MIHIDVTVIHIEDEPDWREAVQGDLEAEVEFEQYFSVENIEQMHEAFKQTKGAKVIIMDLQHQINFSGFDWIADHALQQVHRNPNTTLFVVSSHLNSVVEHTLSRYGVDTDHIYPKEDWLTEIPHFIDVMISDVKEIETTTMVSDKVDPYLNHIIASNRADDEPETEETEQETLWLPMLIQVRLDKWNKLADEDKLEETFPDLQIMSKMEDIIACRGTQATLGALQESDAVISIEASRPADPPDCKQSISFVKAEQIREDLNEYGDQVIVAVIDTGIDVMHHAFRNATGEKTRIIGVWNQRDNNGQPPAAKYLPDSTYIPGSFYTQDQINAFIENDNCPSSLRDRGSGHGTHVASIAAGSKFGTSFDGGVAPEAKILVVVPESTYEVGQRRSLGYSLSHQSALEFIRNFAKDKKLPVVVNVSQGMNAGAHDGKSLLEIAFDKFTGQGRDGGFAIVKSAGNQGDENIHAQFKVPRSSQETLKWDIVDAYHISIELWFPANLRFRFKLGLPSSPMEWVDFGNHNDFEHSFSTGDKVGFSYRRSHEDNGDSRVLITLRGPNNSQYDLKKGIWELKITNHTSQLWSEHSIHAWIERTSQNVKFSNHPRREYSLSIPATANSVIATGALQNSHEPFEVASFSGYGPTRDERKKPEVCAPGVKVNAAKAGQIDQLIRKSGTSMAAPHVCGAIALLFSYWEKHRGEKGTRLNSNQILKAIQHTTQNYNGLWYEGMGYGALDIEQFLKFFQV